jgi:hypothetical protein
MTSACTPTCGAGRAQARWFSDQADREWTAHCIESSKEAFEAGFGRSPKLIRMGDHWLDGDTVALIERLGFQ